MYVLCNISGNGDGWVGLLCTRLAWLGQVLGSDFIFLSAGPDLLHIGLGQAFCWARPDQAGFWARPRTSANRVLVYFCPS